MRALEALPSEIAALEAEQKDLVARMHAPDYYKQPPEVLRTNQQRAARIEELLLEKLEQWESLETKSKRLAP